MFMWRSSILYVFEPFSSEFIPSIKKILIIIIELVCKEDKAEMSMLKTTERQCTRRKEEEITMYYELYLEVKATATKHSVLHFFLAFS